MSVREEIINQFLVESCKSCVFDRELFQDSIHGTQSENSAEVFGFACHLVNKLLESVNFIILFFVR